MTEGNSIEYFYKYKLNENFKERGDQISIAGLILEKDKWNFFNGRQRNLEVYIRTKKNPNGILDFQEVHKIKGEIVSDTEKNYNFIPEHYTRDALCCMKRSELLEICDAYMIDSVNKVDKYLIQRIIDIQNEITKIREFSKENDPVSEELTEENAVRLFFENYGV